MEKKNRSTSSHCEYFILKFFREHKLFFFITYSPQHNSPRIIHHEKIKIPLDEFLILLDFGYMSARFR
jgi:hypothetical protein